MRGAILGSVLALAVSRPGLSFILLLAYALGIGLPFLLVGAFSSPAVKAIRQTTGFLKYFNRHAEIPGFQAGDECATIRPFLYME